MSATVLVVDDDPNILKLLEFTFRQQGFTTLTAKDGVEALQVMETHTPDLVITDVMMPVMDGFELCRRVRADERWRNLPFIFLSARGSPDDRVAGLELGADDYIVKPFDRRELVAKARALLNRMRIYRDQLDKQPEVHAPSRTITRPKKATIRVLIADDDEPMQRLLAFAMRKAGFEVATASNGAEALAEAERQPPDLIISDVLMPVMDGLQLRQKVLEKEHLQMIPFLFLTAKDDPSEMLSALKLGVDDYLTKPINPQVLVQKARNLVERSRQSAEHYRVELEQAAKRISTHLEPEAPRVNGLTIAHHCQPLEIRGGDYYDYMELGGNRIAMILGDVMGKKWGAWFFSVAYIAYLRSVIRSTNAAEGSPGATIHAVNQLLWEDLKLSEVFTTLLVGVIDPAGRTVTYASAGHPPPLHYVAATGEVRIGEGIGVILGVQPNQEYPEETIVLAPGDALVCYSDGITEARNRDGELFGEQRLIEAVRATGTRDAEGIVQGIFEAVNQFAEGVSPEDDRTVIVVRAEG